MLPVTGDIFAVFNARLGAYVAMQVTHVRQEGKHTNAAVLLLSPTFDELPDATQLAAMQPARFDFYFRNDHLEHLWVPARVPQGYTRIGHLAPLIEDHTNSYADWPDGSLFVNQQRWNATPEAARLRFKQAHACDDDSVVLETPHGMKIRRSATRLFTEEVKAIGTLATFDDLPILTSIHVVEPIEGLLDFIRRRPFINEAGIHNHGQHRIDVRDTHLTRFIIDVSGVRDLYVNDDLELLSLVGKADPGLTIHQPAAGRWLSLNTGEVPLMWSGLEALGSLLLNKVREVDVAGIAQRFPALQELRIWGAPCVLGNAEALARLEQLHTLTLTDTFGYQADAFPSPEAWPKLGRLWLSSLPADVATWVKKAYKARALNGLDLEVRQARKPEWLAANLDNPFRDWDGLETITPAQAKKAAALYRKARATALDIAAEAGSSAADLGAVVREYTEGFNALDRRSDFIETTEREDIYVALMGIMDAVDEKRVALFRVETQPVDRAAIDAAMDEVRDF